MNCLCCRDGHEYCECKTFKCDEHTRFYDIREVQCDCGTHEELIDGTVVYYEKCR